MKKRKKTRKPIPEEKVIEVLKEVEAQIHIAQQLPQHIPKELGSETEQKFFEAWSDIKKYPTWLSAVQHPSPKQNRHLDVDAFLVDRRGSKIPVQIKRSATGARGHRKKHKDFPGILVVVLPQDSLEAVRAKTLAALEAKKLPAWLYSE